MQQPVTINSYTADRAPICNYCSERAEFQARREDIYRRYWVSACTLHIGQAIHSVMAAQGEV